jgi:hypothetical protein
MSEKSSPLFWLVFKSGDTLSVTIQSAADIITARMRAMLAGMGTFQEGHRLDDKTGKKVPNKMIGRALSRKEATALLKRLG